MALADKTADAIVTTLLRTYGLEFDEATMNRWVRMMSVDPNNIEMIKEEIRQSDIYRTRFSGMQRRIDNGYEPLSPTEYIALEAGYKETMRAMGMPATFYDSPDDFEEFIVNSVDIVELEQRIAKGYTAAQQAPAEVREALTEFYGIQNSDAALAAYYLDPERALPAIEREYQAAQVKGGANMAGFDDVSKEQAEQLAAMGVSIGQAAEGFGNIAGLDGATSTNLGRGQNFTSDELIAAEFRRNAEAQEKIRRQQERRVGEFQDSQGGGLGSKGVVGLQDTNRS